MEPYTREKAITDLQRLSFTQDEAEKCLDAKSEWDRMEITLQVQKRVKKEQGIA